MPAKHPLPTLAILALLTLALAVITDLFVFPAEQLGAGSSAILLNHTLNAGLWFLVLAVPVTVLFLFWHLTIDLRYAMRRKSGLR